MEALTINELYAALTEARKNGLGNKKIMISSDDEGNEYHELFYSVTTNVEEMFSGDYPPIPPLGVTKDNLKDYVIIG